jgi:2-iminobutanoate/2-iminopropanoate deaminase
MACGLTKGSLTTNGIEIAIPARIIERLWFGRILTLSCQPAGVLQNRAVSGSSLHRGGRMREIIKTTGAPSPIGPYSQAIRANGFVFVSGQIPIEPAAGAISGEDIAAQTRQVMKNLAAILEAAGSGLEKIVKTTVFLANLDDFARFNQVYGEFLGDARPARATVQVARLPKEVLIQVDAVALA